MGLRWGGASTADGGLVFRDPTDTFTGATLAAAIAARDDATTGITDTSEFDADPRLAVILVVTDPDPDQTYYFVRRNAAWVSYALIARGDAGPPGAAGGGALEPLHTYTEATTTANLWYGMGFSWSDLDEDTRLAYRPAASAGLVWLDAGRFLGADAPDAGTDGVASAAGERVSVAKGTASGIAGALYFGTTADGAALVATAQANAAEFTIEFFRYIPSAQQGGGVSEARVQELIEATSLSALQGQVTDAQIPGAIARDAEITSALVIGLITGQIAFTDIAGMIADGQVPATIMRDAELTLAVVATALGLTVGEAAQLLVGAPTVSGQELTFTLADGSTVTRQLPAGMGSGTADGRLIFGMGAPTSSDGIDGDTWIDTAGGTSYEKDEGAWSEVGTFEFTAAVAMVGTRYATWIADGDNPTEAEWLAGNTSVTDHIDVPVLSPDDAPKKRAFAIPATQDSLTVLQQEAGVFNERGLYTPTTSEDDVLQTIAGVSCKTYIQTGQSGAIGAVQTWILRPAPPG